MDWLQTLSIIFTVLGAAYYIHRENHADILNIHEDMRIQGARTDKLYEMFIDLLKDGRK